MDHAEAARTAVQLVLGGEVAELVIDHPPVNALGRALRAALAEALDRALADPDARVIVIRAAGRTFPAGADIAELEGPAAEPTLAALCARIEASPKPVVAALHGTALGGGLELALAAHYRIALEGTRLGFPEIGLGLLPGAGGTQRLPRLTGAEPALRLMLTGRPVPAAEALRLGLLDRVAEGDLPAAARALAAEVAPLPPRPVQERREGMRDVPAYQIAVMAARKAQAASPLEASARIVDCVEAALLLPFAQGMEFERAAFDDLRVSEAAAALRYLFHAERRAGRGAGRLPATVGLGGEGADLADLALLLLQSGLRVTLATAEKPPLVQALARIAGRQEKLVQEGALTEAGREAEWARLTPALGAPALAATELVLAGPGAPLPEDGPPVIRLGGRGSGAALHLSPPAEGGRLAELTLPAAASLPPEAAGMVMALMRRLGRITVTDGVPGGAGARLMTAGRRAVAPPAPPGPPPQPIAAELRGYGLEALAPEGATAGRAEPGQAVRQIVAAMANEGLRILGEGAARHPSDLDLALVAGQGFPRWRGGPMLLADRRGLLVLRRDLRLWAEASDFWQPAPLIDDLIREGLTLARMNED